MDIDPEAVVKSPFVVGALGALASLKFAPGETRWEKFLNVLAGTLAAGFSTPFLAEYLKMPSPAFLNAAAFFIGLLGMSLVAQILQTLRDTQWAAIVTGWLSRRP